MEKKQKRFYKKGEVVWVIELKKEGTVKSINREDLTMTVTYDGEKEYTGKMWSFDKLKYRAKQKLVQEKKKKSTITTGHLVIHNEAELMFNEIMKPKVYFAKVREGAQIPTKRVEDAGYDIYAELSEHQVDEHVEIECPVLATTLVPTGLAVAMPNTHYLNLKHERGSTGVQSISVLAGVVDSGFRNEMFVAITPLRKAVKITSRVTKVEETETHILYPYSKAIAQGTIDLVPKAEVSEITYEELLKIESERGLGMLGESGK